MGWKNWALALCAPAVLLAGRARANEVVNPGFETGDFSGWTLSGNTDGNTRVVGNFNGHSPHSGNFYAALGAVGSLNVIRQSTDITTVPGDVYEVSYWMYSDGRTPNEFDVEFDGNTLFSAQNIPAHDWQLFTYDVTAGGSSAVLEFDSRNDPAYLGLDDVSVTDLGPAGEPVPLPKTAWGGLGLLSLLGVHQVRRRRLTRTAS
jgi:hypothetical protein